MSVVETNVELKTIKVLLFGAEASTLEAEVRRYANLEIVPDSPDVVMSYGGDGTLLAAEWHWPGIPKVPILNSRRGHRCIPSPPGQVIHALAEGHLLSNQYTKIQGVIHCADCGPVSKPLVALNEFGVHMGRINSAVRFKLWINGDAYEDGVEILGDGFVVCTPFGSTAYYKHLTRGIFTQGIGIAFKSTSEHVDHLVLPEEVTMRVQITRGPAVLGYDSCGEFYTLEQGDDLEVRKHSESATILTCSPLKRLDEPF
ncbi:MAG: NAD(+)/NADH kinase [Candidatus Hydrogenedentes bacterium]|nr:NAD(+)/NADH kinase [Candidatus Hydrogenedentota bacterium]